MCWQQSSCTRTPIHHRGGTSATIAGVKRAYISNSADRGALFPSVVAPKTFSAQTGVRHGQLTSSGTEGHGGASARLQQVKGTHHSRTTRRNVQLKQHQPRETQRPDNYTFSLPNPNIYPEIKKFSKQKGLLEFCERENVNPQRTNASATYLPDCDSPYIILVTSMLF